jgi:hypothetical protein
LKFVLSPAFRRPPAIRRSALEDVPSLPIIQDWVLSPYLDCTLFSDLG